MAHLKKKTFISLSVRYVQKNIYTALPCRETAFSDRKWPLLKRNITLQINQTPLAKSAILLHRTQTLLVYRCLELISLFVSLCDFGVFKKFVRIHQSRTITQTNLTDWGSCKTSSSRVLPGKMIVFVRGVWLSETERYLAYMMAVSHQKRLKIF